MIYITKPDGVSVSGTATYSTSKNDIFLRGYISSAGSIIITYEGETFSVCR